MKRRLKTNIMTFTKPFPEYELQSEQPCKKDAELVQKWSYKTELRRDHFKVGKFKTF